MGNKRKNSFDAYAYFKQLSKENKLLQEHKFEFSRVTGLKNLEEVILKLREHSAFFGFDDSDQGLTHEDNGGFFNRRIFTCFLLKKGRLNNMDDYTENQQICRKIFKQIYSRLLNKDSRRLLEDYQIQLDLRRIPFKEIDKTVLNGATGFYFMFYIDEAENLCYNSDEWTN